MALEPNVSLKSPSRLIVDSGLETVNMDYIKKEYLSEVALEEAQRKSAARRRLVMRKTENLYDCPMCKRVYSVDMGVENYYPILRAFGHKKRVCGECVETKRKGV